MQRFLLVVFPLRVVVLEHMVHLNSELLIFLVVLWALLYPKMQLAFQLTELPELVIALVTAAAAHRTGSAGLPLPSWRQNHWCCDSNGQGQTLAAEEQG